MWESLPVELLLRTLALLAPADLVQCRAVCRRWRAAVADLERHDAAFVFTCGVADVQLFPQPSFSSLALDECFSASPRQLAYCTCGAAVAAVNVVPSVAVHVPPLKRRVHRDRYSERHLGQLPPARWEVLAQERALLFELMPHALELSKGVLALDPGCARGLRWLPTWVLLPFNTVRPRTAVELRTVVAGVFADVAQHGHGDPWITPADFVARLADPAGALAVYANANAVWQQSHDALAANITLVFRIGGTGP